MATVEHLRSELDTYERLKDELVAISEGKFAVIHGDNLAGVWDTYEDALHAAYDRFGLKPFLVKRVQRIEQVQFLTHIVPPCPS